MNYPDGRRLTPLEMALHGLRCIAADAGTVIDWHGEERICDASICAEIAKTMLGMTEREMADLAKEPPA